MVLDANTDDLSEIESLEFDFCILGAGVAGIILASTLAQKGYRIALLEGGGFEPSAESQALYEGHVSGLGVGTPEADRLRFFGGTSGHWAGHCMELDEHDFEAKAHAPNSGWPLSRSDLAPYVDAARSWLESGETIGADNDPFSRIRGASFGSVVKPVSQSTANASAGGPTRFGTKYRDLIEKHPGIALVIHANAVDLQMKTAASLVTRVKYVSLDGKKKGSVHGKQFVVCMGGLETPRFLLNANAEVQATIGQAMSNVGCYLGWHPSVKLGYFLLDWEMTRRKSPEVFDWAQADDSEVAYLVPTPGFIESKESLNFLMHLEPLAEPEPKESSWSEYAKDVLCRTDFTARLAEGVYGRIWQCENFRYDGVIYLLFEQHPIKACRVKLSDERDRLGLKKIQIESQLSPPDFKTIRAAGMEIGRLFAEKKIGRVQLEDWIAEENAAELLEPSDLSKGNFWHAMGTTRMAESSDNGVVDSSLKVFGTDNLYVCSSSVFPTFGHANPTVTIAQLALRLAEQFGVSDLA